MEIVIYTRANCPQCELTKRDFDILGIPYKTKDITQDETEQKRLIELGFRSMPVVEANDYAWGGYDQEKIKALVKGLPDFK